MQIRRIVRLLLFIMTLLFLLVGFPNANLIASVPQAFYDISSYAVIGYPEPFSGWEKTITWSDGIKETIEITDKGAIKLNGTSRQAFGFRVLGWMGVPSATLDTILDYMQSKGVRFVDVTFLVKDLQGTKDKMDLYMPKFYTHKMFVHLILKVGRGTGQDAFDPTIMAAWKNNFNSVIDYVDANGWSDMVFAVQVTHELGEHAYNKGKTVQQLSDTLDEAYNHASTKLSTSQIGSVPIIHQAVIWDVPTGHALQNYWKKVLEKTDIIMDTFYPKDLSWLDANIAEIRSLASQVGKDQANGYKIWYEFGRHVAGTNPTYVPVEHFTALLAKNDTAYTLLFFMYENWDDNPTYPSWYFANDGTAESWTENLAPYFP